MGNLILALQILSRYANPKFPTHCEHDIMYVNVDPELVTDKGDMVRLAALGFEADESGNMFSSTYFGSC